MYLRGIVKNAIPLRIAKEYLSLFQFTEKEKEEDFKTPKNLKRTTRIERGLQTENFANDYQLMLFIALINFFFKWIKSLFDRFVFFK